jgi:hypothetical protein
LGSVLNQKSIIGLAAAAIHNWIFRITEITLLHGALMKCCSSTKIPKATDGVASDSLYKFIA